VLYAQSKDSAPGRHAECEGTVDTTTSRICALRNVEA
jgi:hypothetical protein